MIAVTDLVKSHGQVRVLDGATLAVRRGEVAAIIGPSGGGKSTLLRCINGLEPFDSGVVAVGDEHLKPKGHSSSLLLRSIRRRVGMVFQQFNLFPHWSALENVLAGPLYAHGQSRDEAEPEARRLLTRVGLADKAGSRPDQLSGGQQQRVAIARMLAMRPEAILFDEPTSALDPHMAAEVLAVVGELARSGQTMIVVTHAMAFARSAADVVHVMHAGRIIESGPPAQIFDSPQVDATRDFVAHARG